MYKPDVTFVSMVCKDKAIAIPALPNTVNNVLVCICKLKRAKMIPVIKMI